MVAANPRGMRQSIQTDSRRCQSDGQGLRCLLHLTVNAKETVFVTPPPVAVSVIVYLPAAALGSPGRREARRKQTQFRQAGLSPTATLLN
jgi:hypothetical protein